MNLGCRVSIFYSKDISHPGYMMSTFIATTFLAITKKKTANQNTGLWIQVPMNTYTKQLKLLRLRKHFGRWGERLEDQRVCITSNRKDFLKKRM